MWPLIRRMVVENVPLFFQSFLTHGFFGVNDDDELDDSPTFSAGSGALRSWESYPYSE